MRRCYIYIGCMVLMVSIFLNGCAIRREADNIEISKTEGSIKKKEGTVFKIKKETVALKNVIDVFWDMTMEEAAQYYCEGYSVYEVDGTSCTMGYNNRSVQPVDGEEVIDMFSYSDNNEGAYACYSTAMGTNISKWMAEDSLRFNLPLEELDSCTREDAIEACQPYAEALGYGDADVYTYAITLDVLQENADHSAQYINNGGEFIVSAPGPGYEVVTKKQLFELQVEGKEDEAGRLIDYMRMGAVERGITWEKKHEVMLLVYQPYLEGMKMANTVSLKILYVPMYKYAVEVFGETPYEVIGTIEQKELVSESEAVGQLLMIKGYDSLEDIEIKQISLIYAPQYVRDEEWEKAIPCWKIAYERNGFEYNIMIDAIYGDEYVRYPEN